MTNKMPVVGKRYKLIVSPYSITNFYAEVVIEEIDNDSVFYNFDNNSYRHGVQLKNFWKYFEEIPSEKQEEKLDSRTETSNSVESQKQMESRGKSQLEEPRLQVKCEECGKHFKITEFSNNPLNAYAFTNPDCDCHIKRQKPKSQLSDEVLEAMEELKEYFCQSLIDSNDIITAMAHYRELKSKSKALLTALDNQKDCSSENECSVGCLANCKKCNKPFRQSHRGDYFCSNYCIAQKNQAEEKPASIWWKPIKGFDRLLGCHLIKNKGEIRLVQSRCIGLDEALNGDECVSLTDFMQDYEALKAKVDKLMEEESQWQS